ncbi:aldehyde dehydrogenase family protein [Pseudogemmobacter humi]|uniref:3-succinoylsemialdehyde-pyridine dehydrogenase n=1 Tax=Pseudogemmobacter humi TaxID=2483812 RepID=A0A3P5XRV1_9RHOB|nr:aldehyde dehydrogenase family protein [Pseudogemmobacter humi]VDC33607.1 3-succinoylsemialdehyde-pyridine dehydrogenase [Pseudogemmobacter humi]
MILDKFYIDGAWVPARASETAPILNPATEAVIGTLAMGGVEDVDLAVAAARRAFTGFSRSSREERIAMLRRIETAYAARQDEMGDLISQEMGAPLAFARASQAGSGLSHLSNMIRHLESYAFETPRGTTMVRREAIGVVGLITPWNWPMNQIACKVFPALAAGCTMVLKPSELSPLSAQLFAEILGEAGLPKGVFNMVQGAGPVVGHALAAHPGIEMISLTGSTRAGIAVSETAARNVKRVALELGGKAPNILLPDADFETAVARGTEACMRNAGQSCSAPTRMLVPKAEMDRCAGIAARAANGLKVGAPEAEDTNIGPVISAAQFDKVQRLIRSGIDEGARLVAGGPDRPDGLTAGWFVRPTVFADVTPGMTIEREEIFGPVLSMIGYDTVEEAIEIANDTDYGLTAYVQSQDIGAARDVARQLRAGSVLINYAPVDIDGPFGGFKQSGNGREYGLFGLEEFLEVKGMVGYG